MSAEKTDDKNDEDDEDRASPPPKRLINLHFETKASY